MCIVVTILCLVQSAHFNWKPLLILCRSGYDLDIFIQSRIVQVYTTVLQQFLQTWVQLCLMSGPCLRPPTPDLDHSDNKMTDR